MSLSFFLAAPRLINIRLGVLCPASVRLRTRQDEEQRFRLSGCQIEAAAVAAAVVAAAVVETVAAAGEQIQEGSLCSGGW